ncbi:hypothetical protein BJ138DRAFT_1130448 [Hygrophoropsis aurantiaca]|uniref:Uncharacterized protein n=1 Tax=Hygrophoropsis aurantiaca TaxID=72124 RepID=A0ACB7ZWW4_9AGAM|nr:hypothetical protein BJ138DRAFT_1130448 [Hygrophoropsis aurantiaca]
MESHTEQHDTSTRTTIEILETEVLELEKKESDLLAQLHPLQAIIAHKRSLAGKLKNSLVPVNRLPNEILLACFDQAVQDWADENAGADEQNVAQLACVDWEGDVDFELPCTPVFAISHVSHHWRQLAINAPSLWTNHVVTPAFGRHMDIFRDVLHRAKGAPIAATFRCSEYGFRSSEYEFRAFEDEQISSGTLLMEAIMPLIHAQQIKALTFFCSPPMLSSLSQSLLSAAPQLKTLKLQYDTADAVKRADRTVVTLPMLENLTIMQSNRFVSKLLGSLSAPNVRQLKLLAWHPVELSYASSCLFIRNNNRNSSSRVPRFPSVRNLVLSSLDEFDELKNVLIKPSSLAPPTFQWLQHLTLDFSFEEDFAVGTQALDPFTWLPKPRDRADRPLLILVLDRSTESTQDADKYLFWYYKELQQYGTLDRSSSRLEEFMQLQALADDDPEAAML